MTHILEKLASVLTAAGMTGVELGRVPDEPDALIALTEYQPPPPEHYFGGTDWLHAAQALVRGPDAAAAYSRAEAVTAALNRYADGEISALITSPIFDAGRDGANPSRQKYTINITIRRI